MTTRTPERTPRAMRRHTARGQARRRTLIEHAARLIDERGLAQTRVVDIAEAAGVPPSLFYWYFEDLDDLVRQAVIDARRAVRQTVADATAGYEDAIERLYVGTRELLTTAVADEIYRVMTSRNIEGAIAEPYAQEIERSVDAFIDDVLKLLAEGQAQGVVRDDKPTLHLAYCLRSVVHYTLLSYHRGRILGSADALAATTASFAIRGVCADPAHAEAVERKHI